MLGKTYNVQGLGLGPGQLPKAYDPQGTEDRIYALWEQSGAFTANNKSRKKPFTISMPPPNATGQLHLGHAVMLALEDIFIRFERMQGKEALWVPGTDHAAIATENVVIRMLKEQGVKDPRKELGREKLVEKIAEFVENSKNVIRGQVRKMGSSCDWSRERYTFEPALNRIVNEVFKKMYDDGLIYRGHRIVNWDPKLQTTVSDDEVHWKEETVPFYTFQYGPFQIATARPETKFGDKYVVMHPDDERYKDYKHGQTFTAEWINGPVQATVIKDDAVDPAFGTGVMTITPWHDTADFDIAQRHGLDPVQIIDFEGKLLPIAGGFAGMDIEKARPLVVEKLKSKGLVVKTEEAYVHNKATNSRGGGTIEPQIKLQWFVDVNKRVVPWKGPAIASKAMAGKKGKEEKLMSLKEVMQSVVKDGDIKIIPERFEKTYFHWIDHLRDWCISRQIWWGHRIPVWYKGDEVYAGHGDRDRVVAGVHPPEGDGWTQDPDTLDTWFSSALWTWSTLLDPKLALDPSISFKDILKKSLDYKKFHPTQVMETGYDILFFWVARMILMTTYATGEIPFETVYLHGLIRTRDGQKMSKSHPETIIDPLDMISKYGADALRLSMIVAQSPGNDSRLYEEKIAGYRNFVNKLWNASRFVLMQCEQAGVDPHAVQLEGGVTKLPLADRAMLSRLQTIVGQVTKGLEQYRLSEVGETLYSFVWDDFCDWYLELSKGNANIGVLVHMLRTILHLLHPYCPYVTEEIWSFVSPAGEGLLIKQPWPKAKKTQQSKKHEAELLSVISVIQAIRRIRAEQNVETGKEIAVIIHTKKWGKVLASQEAHIRRLAKVGSLTFETKAKQYKNAASHGARPGVRERNGARERSVASEFLQGIEVHVPLEGLIDLAKEKENLTKERENLQRFIVGIEGKLKNEEFVKRAPKEVVETEKEKLKTNVEKLKKIEERLKGL